MKRLKYSFILLVVLSVFIPKAKAQVSIDVRLDTNMMLIGDQTNFVLQATFPKNVDVVFPVFTDTIIDKLEILNISDIDTIIENETLKLTQQYLVTSFDSGWYEVPPAHFGIQWEGSELMDTLSSNPVYFGVIPMPLDTANANAIADIKKPIGAPITVKETLPFIAGFLAYLVLFFLGYFIYKRFIKKEPIFVKKEKPKEPAHIIALRDLDALSENKLWQKGKNKEYYSELTDIIRTYIEDRYNVPAMEQTTDEIIASFKYLFDVPAELKETLFATLKQADFVKFAKAMTLAEENEKSLKFAYDFVLKTKLTVKLREDEEKEQDENDTVVDSKEVKAEE